MGWLPAPSAGSSSSHQKTPVPLENATGEGVLGINGVTILSTLICRLSGSCRRLQSMLWRLCGHPRLREHLDSSARVAHDANFVGCRHDRGQARVNL
jgi:hypothetical protein